MNADQALDKVLSMEFQTVLDVGAGGDHADTFRNNGKTVTTLNFTDADICSDFLTAKVGAYDLVWASHVLEHCPNPNLFLKKAYSCLNSGGILAITVPPLKHEIVGGHVSLWNPGLLLYHLVLAGFDCSEASVKEYGYNISVVLRKKQAKLPALSMDCGDIEKLARFFPFPAQHGFDGRLREINW